MIFAAMSAAASPGNPLDFYVGAEGGTSNIRITSPFSGSRLDAHSSGWGIFAGLRPISLIGAELEYIDFGDATAQSLRIDLPDAGAFSETAKWRQRATTLSAIIYAPTPTQLLDVYAKGGVARLQTNGHDSGSRSCGIIPSCQVYPPTLIHIDDINFRFAYGAGVQIKVAAIALRVEYQRIGAGGKDPDLLSVGLALTF
jgi:opacity protein-like surface antigen